MKFSSIREGVGVVLVLKDLNHDGKREVASSWIVVSGLKDFNHDKKCEVTSSQIVVSSASKLTVFCSNMMGLSLIHI